MYKLSFLFLLLSTPLLPSTPYAGVPLWAWVSLCMTLIYACVLVLSIENDFDDECIDG